MGLLERRPALRWTVPAAAVAVVVGAVAWTSGADAADHPDLPAVSAQQLLADLQQPTTDALEGTVSWDVDLGLPDLSALGGIAGAPSGGPAGPGGGTGPSGTSALLTGSHTLRVWADGPQRARVAIVDGTRETDVVRDGRDVWTWESADRTATHVVLPDPATLAARHGATGALRPDLSTQVPPTPDAAARALLDAVGPSTTVTTDSTARVAGRPAYELVLDPKDPGTLVDRAVIAVDAATHVPLRVQVYSTRATDPAVDVGFTRVTFTTPDASRFTFVPPRDATVHEPALPSPGSTAPDHGPLADLGPTIVGDGWDQVAVVRLTPEQAAALGLGSATHPSGTETSGTDSPDLTALLDTLPTVHGDFGSGHALAGTVFSVLVTDDGRVAVGAVPVDALEAALTHAGRLPVPQPTHLPAPR